MILDDESAPDRSIAKLAELASTRLGEMSDLQNARGLHDVVAKFDRVRAGSNRVQVRPLWLVGAGAVAVLGLVLLLIGPSLWSGKPLTYAMSQGQIEAGGYFQSGMQSQPTIRFSDGTQVDLAAGARGRVASVDAHGARVMLDQGEAHVEVVPRSGAHWQFDAGDRKSVV